MAHTPGSRRAAAEKVRLRRQTWLEANGPCAICGSEDNLEVDHIIPEEKESHRIWSWSEPRRTAELSKCQVLCTDCHKIKTNAWKREKVKHGNPRMYRLGCRCYLCKGNWNLAKADRRRKRKALGLPRD